VHALLRSPDLANAYVAASATLGVPSFRFERDNLVGSFRGGRREIVLVMGEHVGNGLAHPRPSCPGHRKPAQGPGPCTLPNWRRFR